MSSDSANIQGAASDENSEGKDSADIITASSKSPERRPSVDENQEAKNSSGDSTASSQSLTEVLRPSVVDENPSPSGLFQSSSKSQAERPSVVDENGVFQSSSKSLAERPLPARGLIKTASVLDGIGDVSFQDVTKKTKKGLKKVTKKTKKVTKKTVKHVGRALQDTEEGVAKVTEITGKHVGRALQDTEEVYEKSPWCRLPRFLVKHFPRVFSFVFGVVVPLWFLIALSWGFGALLASYEAPHEQEANHAILQSRAKLNRTFVNRTDLAQLPVQCYMEYLNHTDRSKFEQRIDNYIFYSSNLETKDAANFTAADNDKNNTDDTIEEILVEAEVQMYLFMLRCQHAQGTETRAYLKVEEEDGDSAAESLSFNWNRCWSKEIRDEWGGSRAIYFPSLDLIEASRPAQQEAAVETEFVRILDEAENECLDLGEEEDECFEKALQEASESAGNICHDNVEGTSWFFFTVMTTVGYGNQAPVTFKGRMLIYIAGIVSLILFAAVLGSAGYIITTIFDDFVSRLMFAKFLQNPFVGVFLWGGIWISWAYAIAFFADVWWAGRLPDYDVDTVDAMWFAFISTSTIGLGDYFLQPEVMFARDALGFSVVFLVGFVLLSTFLNKLGDFLFEMLPKRESSLETRLKETNLILWTHWPCNDSLRSRLRPYLYEANDSEYGSSEPPQQNMQQQVERVKAFMAHLPNNSLPPPMNTMNIPEGEKDMVNLLDEEEMILKALLESLEQRRTELNRADEESNPSVVKRTPSLIQGPPQSSERSFSVHDSPISRGRSSRGKSVRLQMGVIRNSKMIRYSKTNNR